MRSLKKDKSKLRGTFLGNARQIEVETNDANIPQAWRYFRYLQYRSGCNSDLLPLPPAGGGCACGSYDL